MKKLSVAVLVLAVLAGCASMKPPLAAQKGVLVNDKGLTVYTFDRDVANSGKSVCNGDCAVKWPPVMAGASEQPRGEFTEVVTPDGEVSPAPVRHTR